MFFSQLPYLQTFAILHPFFFRRRCRHCHSRRSSSKQVVVAYCWPFVHATRYTTQIRFITIVVDTNLKDRSTHKLTHIHNLYKIFYNILPPQSAWNSAYLFRRVSLVVRCVDFFVVVSLLVPVIHASLPSLTSVLWSYFTVQKTVWDECIDEVRTREMWILCGRDRDRDRVCVWEREGEKERGKGMKCIWFLIKLSSLMKEMDNRSVDNFNETPFRHFPPFLPYPRNRHKDNTGKLA